MKQQNPTLPEEVIMHKIYLIRGQKVMLDRDLATLYSVKTKVLNQAVQRNLKRFPSDFMFQLSNQEFTYWKSQIVTSNFDKMGWRKPPFCFTEQGVAMLSSVLGSEKAISVNIEIIRVFTRLRLMLYDNTELRLEIENIKKKTENNSKNIELVFQYLDELLDKKENSKTTAQIGFKTQP